MTTPEINTTPPAYPTLVKRESTLAIISLISGILGWTIFPFIASIVAVITGHLAKKEIRESGGTCQVMAWPWPASSSGTR